MAFVVVECELAEPTTLPALRETEARCADRFEKRDLKRLRAFLSRDGRRLVLHYEAPDVESVREVVRGLGLPTDRIWAGTSSI